MTYNTSFLFSEYRKKVLHLLLLHPETSYHVREIARLTKTTAGTLHKELSSLANLQVLLRKKNGNQVCYQANTLHPIFHELASILRKTSGSIDMLTDALRPLQEKIKAAFVFGSIAQGTENLNSDIDVLIVGDVSFIEIVKALYSSQQTLGREINPKIYSQSEWKKLLKQQHPFIKDILQKPKIFLLGTIDDLR
jgi:predicted nucleotidyltransferase